MKSFLFVCLCVALSAPVGAQVTGIVQPDPVQGALHRAGTGKIVFTPGLLPVQENDAPLFINQLTVNENANLALRAYLGNSLVNYLHQLDTGLNVDELVAKGNYQFSFLVDGRLVYTENLNTGAGTTESKKFKTILQVPLISTANEDSWGRFLWMRFYMGNGGEDALAGGPHLLQVEMRPYLKTNGVLKTGGVIAKGSISFTTPVMAVDPALVSVQTIRPNSGWQLSKAKYDTVAIRTMNEKILSGRFKQITGIVVIKEGKLLLEEYFNGASRNTLHDTRSVGKSFTGAVMGIALKDGYIKSEEQTLADFYNLALYDHYSKKKDSVTLKSLLTMSSGFEGSDSNEDSPGNEEKMYPTANWVNFTLNLPMDSTRAIGREWDYFTAGVVLLGDILHRKLPGGLEQYAAKKLFKPLGITRYKWQYTPQQVANTAGGLQMRLLDYARFGQLYQNGGVYNGRQFFRENWVKKSFTNYFPGTPGFWGYGYLFWKQTYKVGGNTYEAFVCNGNGGNKILVFTKLPLVMVITATAYNKPYAHNQVEKMIQEYILPAMLSAETPAK